MMKEIDDKVDEEKERSFSGLRKNWKIWVAALVIVIVWKMVFNTD